MLPTIPSLRKPEYQISNSLRFRSSASAYLSRTPSVTGSQTTWTWSGWIKRGALAGSSGTVYGIFGAGTDNSANRTLFWFDSGDKLVYQQGNTSLRTTTAVFRDTSAWGHLVVAVDNSNSTAANRILMYWNGVLLATTGTGDPGSTQINLVNVSMKIGTRTNPPTTECFDGYMAEVHFVDGQALTPAAFGATSSKTGVWAPRSYAGTYGTNGFYLKFNNTSSVAALGTDSSGNSNTWTPINISLTTGSAYDSMIDVPTPYADGGSGRGNYAVLNPLAVTPVAATFAEANLKVTTATTGGNAFATMAIPSSGKWYWEVTLGSNSNPYVGVASYLATQTYAWASTNSVFYSVANATKTVDGTSTSYGTTGTTNDVIGVAVDVGASTITFYKNNISQGAISHTFVDIYPALTDGGSATSDIFTINFGQRPFAYTPPTGFKALNTNNLPDPAIVHGHAYMATTTYTGTGVGRNISNFSNNRSFRPDLVWIKSRSNATDHALYDTLRGAQQDLVSNSTAAETTQSTGLTAFNEDGFGLSTLTKLNSAGNTYVAWQWKAGDGVVTNTAGSITSQVDAGTTQGVSVVTYTGTGANATVGHGLGVAPKMIIVKHRNSPTPNMSWNVYHASLGNTKALFLDTTGAEYTDSPSSLRWNNTSPTNTVFSIGTAVPMNQAGTSYVAYCFAEIAGYSKFGSYTGNGSADGPFCFTGFRPRWVMVKAAVGGTGNWVIHDTSRSGVNFVGLEELSPNVSGKEPASIERFDFVSNGFKVRSITATDYNTSGVTYIYAAFAEVPSKYALAR